MATNICLPGFLALFLAASVSCHDVTPGLMQYIGRLESRMEHLEEKYSVEIRNLQEQLKRQEGMYNRKIEQLHKRLAHVEEINILLVNDREENRASSYGDQVKTLPEIQDDHQGEPDDRSRDDVDSTSTWNQHKEKTKLENAEPILSPSDIHIHKKRMALITLTPVDWCSVVPFDDVSINNVRFLQRKDVLFDDVTINTDTLLDEPTALGDGTNVAFSAYMDNDTEIRHGGQVLIYNQILLNDGDGYNKHTGIFTAPVAGVYSFSFFVGERDIRELWVTLYVNSVNKVGAAVQTWHTYQDLQGGNTVNLKIAAGDAVYVESVGDNTHVEGSNIWRITTFSGFLIYPVHVSAVVG